MKTPRNRHEKLVYTVRPAMDIAEQLDVKIISDKQVNFSKKKAYEYLELDTFQGERAVNERHVQFLYSAWAAGRYQWSHVIIALCQCEGKTYRINGQHTSWMRVNLPDDYFIKRGEEPRVREIVYSAANESQMRTLYSSFDQNKTRTPSHVFRALMAGTKQAEDLWPSSLNMLSAGMKHWLFEFKDRWMINANDISALVADKHEQLFRIVGLYIQQHYAEQVWLRRAGVVAALFATFDKAGGKAPEFWDSAITGLGLTDKTDPRYVLHEYLGTHGQGRNTASTARGLRNLTNAEDTYRICILAWNKWRKGEKQRMGFKTTETRNKPV